jgi:hypothetical protein
MSRPIAFITKLFRRIYSDAEQATAGAGEVWGGDFEALAIHYLRQAHTVNLQELIERVAEEALRAEIRGGGWAVDAGVWGPTIFRQEATRAVQRLVGRTLVLEDDGALLAVWAV